MPIIPIFPRVNELREDLRKLVYADPNLCRRLEQMLKRKEVALQDVDTKLLMHLTRLDKVVDWSLTVDGKRVVKERDRRTRFVECVQHLDEINGWGGLFFNANVSLEAIIWELYYIEAKSVKDGGYIDCLLPQWSTMKTYIRNERRTPSDKNKRRTPDDKLEFIKYLQRPMTEGQEWFLEKTGRRFFLNKSDRKFFSLN